LFFLNCDGKIQELVNSFVGVVAEIRRKTVHRDCGILSRLITKNAL